ncbi:glycoside hydrolase [Frankia sp. AgPm24]|uniref:GH25 family lysozyme n=1 Tax=Frankia sp. AgPm24 TaxID=631128 RepID=UPI00200CEF61|nr:GH25 family lysozyme [Frankia sp. AgPm24]MCK9924504.1 glycoside hydrolase [Frankia sp. AgPm24]
MRLTPRPGRSDRPHTARTALAIPLPRRLLPVARITAARITAATLTAATLTVAATVGVAQAAGPSPLWPRGVDISSWQHPYGAAIDWNAVHAAGVSFVYIKATENNQYTNKYYAGDRDAATKAGLAVGAFHYARPSASLGTAVEQAKHFVAAIGPAQAAGFLPPALDLEETGGLGPRPLAAWTRAFLEEVESETGRVPMVYSSQWFWTDRMANTREFTRYPLWFANHNDRATPNTIPGGWPGWAVWQYSATGTVAGIASQVDQDVLCCTPATLATLADGTRSEIQKWHAGAGLTALALGAPVGVENRAGGGGRWQQYANGLEFWSVATGVHALYGPISSKYLGLGGSNSFLGRPVSDVESATASGGQQARFQGGWVYWGPATGAHEVHGRILSTYLGLGGSGSPLGLPTSDEYSVPGGRQSTFERGRLRWDAATGQVSQLPPGP